MNLLKENGAVSAKSLAEKLNFKDRPIQRYIKALKNKVIIEKRILKNEFNKKTSHEQEMSKLIWCRL